MEPSWESTWTPVVIAIVFPNLFGWIETYFTRDALKNWFPKLKKPPWQPPAWIFVPVWNLLYACMGYASYIVWREGQLSTSAEVQEQVRCALWAYGIQLFINWIWNPVFFHLRYLGVSTIISVLLWVAVGFTICEFYVVSHTAAYLLLPYFGWGTFAITVNYYMYKHNPWGGDQNKQK